MPDVFLSYSREDQPVARRIAAALEREGFSVWWDQALAAGDAFDEVTEKALTDARAVVVLWSPRSVSSRWVRAEAAHADEAGKLVPALIESCSVPVKFKLTQTADLSGWKGDPADSSWQVLLAGVRRFVTGNAVATTPAAAPQHGRWAWTPAWMAGVAVGLLAIAGVVAWLSSDRRAEPVATQSAAPPGGMAAVTAATLAVLPFADMSPEHDQDYLSEGLAEEILIQLAQLRDLTVIARTSSFSFKGRNEDVRVIGKTLGVAYLLEGSVRKNGEQLKISAQLIDSRNGAELWSQSYARDLKDVFAIQEEIATAVTRALSIKLDVGELPRVQGGTTHVEAYEKYLLARNLYQHNEAVGYQQAAQLLREAVKLDPQFVRAWLLLTYALRESINGVPPDQSGPERSEAAAAAGRVLELAPESWGAQVLRAGQFMAARDWMRAEAALTAAGAPAASWSGSYEMVIMYALFLRHVGRVGEAARVFRQARQVDPLSLYASSDLQTWLDAAGQSSEAQIEYQRSKGLAGNHGQANLFEMMRLLARKDANPEAIKAQFRALLERQNPTNVISRPVAEAFGSRTRVRAALQKAIDDSANRGPIQMSVAAMYADRFEQKDLALEAMRVSVGELGVINALWLPMTTDLRSDPQFKALVRAAGLPEYWRASGNWGDLCRPLGDTDFECR